MRTARYALLPHPADIGIRSEGPDLAAALDQAVAALAHVQCGAAVARGPERRVVQLDAVDREELVVRLLDECLYLLDARDWQASGASVEPLGLGGTTAQLAGAPFRVPDDGVHVKAVTWHRLAVVEDADGAEITVYLDI